MKRVVPLDQRCFFCASRWTVAIGGQRLCAHHHQLVDQIAKDAGVPVHITVHRLSRDGPPTGPQKISDIMPAAMADILANQKPPPRSREVPTPHASER